MREIKIGKFVIGFFSFWVWGPCWKNTDYWNVGFISIFNEGKRVK